MSPLTIRPADEKGLGGDQRAAAGSRPLLRSPDRRGFLGRRTGRADRRGPAVLRVRGFLFLSSLAVRPEARDDRIASQMIEQLAAQAGKPIYLYTIIPEFFRKLGFQDSLFLPQPPLPRPLRMRRLPPGPLCLPGEAAQCCLNSPSSGHWSQAPWRRSSHISLRLTRKYANCRWLTWSSGENSTARSSR